MAKGNLASIPRGVRVYAVGDIHGRVDLLADVLAKIDRSDAQNPNSRAIEVFLGDYIDRGPDSFTVLEQLIWRSRFRSIIFLRGNHEAIFLDFLRNPAGLTQWQRIGGRETLMSYGLRPPLNPTFKQQTELAVALARNLPRSHRYFLETLQSSFVCGDFFFAHAGVRPGVSLPAQQEEDLLWIREAFLEYTGDFGKIVVHGHTPVREPELRPNRINIDTGAYATGRLTCFLFEQDYIYSI